MDHYGAIGVDTTTVKFVDLMNAGRTPVNIKSPTAYGAIVSGKVFRVTHPFHPWLGRQFEVLHVRRNRGEDRLFFIGLDP